ncbi:LysR family transcriptional regulator [Oceanomicrobium pacificus]|uniref:LysR family transcriptional regulator n=1 Tax=Oceanomicrobium pacificus TaxID=2692916 RepID=A0A6B0U062_9RHOB|nr:LysR family transcriptional regulator [Oceanomicrobium pacificus]MXU64531.1 LysR family transcriptional regulator [Oceanomicrobium pacificus]
MDDCEEHLCNNERMEKWDDMRLVLEVVRAGSLTEAAARLKVSHATLSRRIAGFEARSGRRLFDRQRSGVVPTPEGRAVAEAALRMEDAADRLDRLMAAGDHRLEGPITFTAPQLLMETHLNRICGRFLDAHPGIELTVLASNDMLNLAKREADVALRVTAKPPDTLVGQRLCPQRTGIFGRRDYVERLRSPGNRRADWIGFTWWGGVPPRCRTIWPDARLHMRFDDMVAARAAIADGLGIGRMPYFLGNATPGLVPVPELGSEDYPDVWLLTHRDLRRVDRLLTFRRFVADAMRAVRPAFVGPVDRAADAAPTDAGAASA